MKYGIITILDYDTDEVHIYKYYLNQDISIEDFIVSCGHKLNRIKYMLSDEIKLTIH